MCATTFSFIEFGGGEKHIVLQIVSIFIHFIKAVDMIEFTKIYKKLEELEKLTLLSAKEMLTIDEAARYLEMSKSYLYIMTCKKQIPYYKPNGKRLYFKKTELNEWLQSNRVTPLDEAESSAALYIAKKGGNNE